jgi:glycosyltransferase involved in cell wall biosynthesis
VSSSENREIAGAQAPRVSLVTTVLNEADHLPELLHSIQRQTLQPAEVIFVDAGSSDGTIETLHEWCSRLPMHVISLPGANISEGRNAGIRQAQFDYIAVTDAGVLLESDWLERLVAPLTQIRSRVDVSAGFFVPEVANGFGEALAASTLPDASEINPKTFLPSSRSVAFRKSWFEAGVRYPEWLDYCEDLVFDLRLKRAGAQIAFQPEAIVRFRPRSDVRSFAVQYYRYARGDGKAGLFANRHLIRYVTYLLVIPSTLLTRSWYWRAIVLLGAVGYILRPVRRLWGRTGGNAARTLLMVPLVAALRAVGDLAKMVGYPAGLLWRARTHGLRRNWTSIPEREPD